MPHHINIIWDNIPKYWDIYCCLEMKTKKRKPFGLALGLPRIEYRQAP